MQVVVIGATGLVGAMTVREMLDNGCTVDGIVRRPAGLRHPRWREHVASAADWPRIARTIGAEAAVSALGTTTRKAGDEAGFRAVDHDMVLEFARAARDGGARRMATVSSVGAVPGSSNFYLRLKGEMEQAVQAVGFDRLDIFRPGLLRGPRGADRRLGERLGILVSPLVNLALRGPLDRFAAIDAGAVACAIAASLRCEEPGVFVHDNRAIRRLARR